MKYRDIIVCSLCLCLLIGKVHSAKSVPQWHKYEFLLKSEKVYENPLYDITHFYASFHAPSGRIIKINGFWDGGKDWKLRFMPDEAGLWRYKTYCSDPLNKGLHGIEGQFECIRQKEELSIYKHGRIQVEPGNHFFSFSDGTPFFWLACTAWNGGLKSTPEEWDHYLKQRKDLGYNVIQMVTTQWRGCSQNSNGEVAFTGCGRIRVNPSFFRHMDEKVDEVNENGHTAALVLLWTLPFGDGRELSPGYYLPDKEAVLLARYIVSRYQANHVVWMLGGDGKYFGELEDRWKFIGNQVFKDNDLAPVTLHPLGRSWIGGLYADEGWYDFVGYQSTHGTSIKHVNFINKTVHSGWSDIRAMPVINMEPCYEQIRNKIFADDVRNACYWSVFAAPPSGVTYGADGVWPWLREGEKPENHTFTPEVDSWDKGIELPGSYQIAYLGEFFRQYSWWDLLPAQDLLLEQPGNKNYLQHISVLSSRDHDRILVYFPAPISARILLPPGNTYTANWFDPVANKKQTGEFKLEDRMVEIKNPLNKDAVLVLHKAQ